MNPQESYQKVHNRSHFLNKKAETPRFKKNSDPKNCIFRKVELLWKLYKDQINKLLRYTNPVMDYAINGVG